MATKIFINYRRDDFGMAGRLHDRLAQTFGRKAVFMDVDQIPPGVDFVEHLNSQLTACNVFLAIIGPNWLNAADESGKRRLDNPDDYVRIEIAAALGRSIPLIPVLIEGARMPKANELPNPIESLARRQAVEVRHSQFGRDSESLITRLRNAMHGKGAGLGQWPVLPVAASAALAVLLLVGWGGYAFLQSDLRTVQETLQQQNPLLQSPGFKREENSHTSAASAFYERGGLNRGKGDYPRAIADFSEAIRLDPTFVLAYCERGFVLRDNGDLNSAFADFNEAIRLDPNDKDPFYGRGLVYYDRGDYRRAIADFTEAIRLDPKFALAFCARGKAKSRISDRSGKADIAKAKRLNPSDCPR